MRARVAAILLAASLAACGEAAPDARASATAARVLSAKGEGIVTAVDREAGTVTLDHQAMPEIGWPAMTMAFAADPGLLAGVRAGDRVAFALTLTGEHGEVTALTVE